MSGAQTLEELEAMYDEEDSKKSNKIKGKAKQQGSNQPPADSPAPQPESSANKLGEPSASAISNAPATKSDAPAVSSNNTPQTLEEIEALYPDGDHKDKKGKSKKGKKGDDSKLNATVQSSSSPSDAKPTSEPLTSKTPAPSNATSTSTKTKPSDTTAPSTAIASVAKVPESVTSIAAIEGTISVFSRLISFNM